VNEARQDVSAADLLDPLERLAVAYAPATMRPAWTGFLALDRRLADAARAGRDPIMIQLRLAWWRDRFDAPAENWPAGEPLLATLRCWEGERPALRGLVDGWEARNVGDDGGAELGKARIAAVAALARLSGIADDAEVRRAAAEWLGEMPVSGPAPRLPRAMRPLAILRGMALREDAGKAGSPWRDLMAAMRLGMIGR